jgi:hypothetical protein
MRGRSTTPWRYETARQIPEDEIRFHPHSFGDSDGRLFYWRGALYRAISIKRTSFFQQLLQDGAVKHLVSRGSLIESEPTHLAVKGYGLVVQHRPLPFLSYPGEWCAPMFREATLNLLDLEIDLSQQDLTLKDGHPWNIVFDAVNPVYVDLTSIETRERSLEWQAYDEFCRFCYFPLILMCHGQERIARVLVSEYEGVRRSDFLTLMLGAGACGFVLSKILSRTSESLRSLMRTRRRSGSRVELLRRIRRNIEELRMPSEQVERLDQRAKLSATGLDDHEIAVTQRLVEKTIMEVLPKSVLEINSGEESYAKLAARLRSKVVVFSADNIPITQLYWSARAENLPILPLVLDFAKPTPSIGYGGHYSIAATERLKCDMTLALGLVQRMVFEKYLSFELIVEGLSLFSERWLLVDFVAQEDSKAQADRFPWYTLDRFRDALSQRFQRVDVVRLRATRSLLICEK